MFNKTHLALAALTLSLAANSANANEATQKTCVIVGAEKSIDATKDCPGTVAEYLRSVEIEKEHFKVDAAGNKIVDANGEPVMEPYAVTYRLMANYASAAGLGEALNGGEVPHLHNGMMENDTITIFAISDSVLTKKVADAVAKAETAKQEPLSVKEKELVLYEVVGSQIATRPYYKDDMWNGQMEYKSLGGKAIKTNFLRAEGDIANGMTFEQMDIEASNGVIHLMN